MTTTAHLWAVGFDSMERAEQVREVFVKLADKHCLILIDSAVAVRYTDGLVTLDGEPFVSAPQIRGNAFARFLAGLALGGPPLTAAAVGTLERNKGSALTEFGIDEGFVNEVQALMQPGTSVIFVLDREREMAAILQGIRGLGGTVLKTNVDLERAQLIQSTLATADAEPSSPDQE